MQKIAEEEFNKVFRNKELPSDMPVFETDKNNYLLDLLCDTKLAPSKNEAKRLIEGGMRWKLLMAKKRKNY